MDLSNLYRIDARVYVAGIQIPYNTINLSTAFNNLPRCTISIPPDPRLYGIGRNDRVPVHVFLANTFCQEDEDYLLMFEGEIESFGYVNNSIGREFVINAQSNLAFLQDVSVRLLTNLDAYAQAMVPGAGASALNAEGHSGISMPASLFFHGLGNVSSAGGTIKVPYEFLENTAKFILGDYSESVDTALARFFRSHALMLKFSQRCARVRYFDDGSMTWGSSNNGFPVLSALQTAAAVNRVTGLMSNGPQQGSLYDMLNYVVSNLEYEMSVFASPTPSSSGRLNAICLKPMLYDADPPRCNVLFRAGTESLRSTEKIYGVPTRVRTRDISGTFANLTQGDNSIFSEIGMQDFYPYTQAAEPGSTTPTDVYNAQLLPEERKTGPFLADAQAPIWLSYINPETVAGRENSVGEQMRKHMYLLKRYEPRNLAIQSVFNPFITPGFPGVVFDSEQQEATGFVFAGHILSVTHTISKGGASTSVQMGFVRTLEEETSDRLKNSYAPISDQVTHDPSKTSALYQDLIGCPGTSYSELKENGQGYDAQTDPFEMYRFNQRNIATLQDYAGFMGLSLSDDLTEMSDNGSGYLEDRMDGSLRATLREIAEEAFENEIYRSTG